MTIISLLFLSLFVLFFLFGFTFIRARCELKTPNAADMWQVFAVCVCDFSIQTQRQTHAKQVKAAKAVEFQCSMRTQWSNERTLSPLAAALKVNQFNSWLLRIFHSHKQTHTQTLTFFSLWNKKKQSQNTQRLILEENKNRMVTCEIRGGNPAPQIEWILEGKNISKEVSIFFSLSLSLSKKLRLSFTS